MAGKREILKLYRCLLRESEKFSDYNFREYTVRRVRDCFKEHRNDTDPGQIKKLIIKAEKNLEVIKRQVTIGQMYEKHRLVVEGTSQPR